MKRHVGDVESRSREGREIRFAKLRDVRKARDGSVFALGERPKAERGMAALKLPEGQPAGMSYLANGRHRAGHGARVVRVEATQARRKLRRLQVLERVLRVVLKSAPLVQHLSKRVGKLEDGRVPSQS